MNNELKIPEKQRNKFSQPLGKLIAGTREETIAVIEAEFRKQEEKLLDIKFYLVGDIVTQDFLKNTYLRNFIKLCIIDEKTQRNQIKVECEDFFKKIIEFENPKGVIKQESFQILTETIKEPERILLKIKDGEEDLLLLPLISVLPLEKGVKNIAFYGQPPITDSLQPIAEGIVMVEVNKKIQKTVNKFLRLMQSS